MEIQINPFEDDIVVNPREVQTSVVSLNEKSLQGLLGKFHLLLEPSLIKKRYYTHAWLVTSASPGYGKSHLIGRLFQALDQKATLIYLRPFENTSTSWKSILLKTVQELDFSDILDCSKQNNKIPTQLEVFSTDILINMLSGLLKEGLVQEEEEKRVTRFCKELRLHNFWNDSKNVDWVISNSDKLRLQFVQKLKSNGVTLNASPQSWLNVLFNYCIYNRSSTEIRETCLEWLKGESIDPDEARSIGIRSKDVLFPEMKCGEIDEICKLRVIDFCQLARFSRPFLFCFDQTENYGKSIELIRLFGIVIENLVSLCPNQMTVVTANQYVWEKRIIENIEDAHKDRFNKGFELDGINKEQGEELIKQRLHICKISSNEIKYFAGERWLNDLFKDSKAQIGIRHFINACRDQWDKKKNKEVKIASIENYFEKNIRNIRSQPKRYVFEPDILYWMIFEVANGISGVTVKKFVTEKGYFVVKWLLTGQSILFGFESGSNCTRWRAIAREAKRYWVLKKNTKAVMLRTFELPKIPKATWKVIGKEIEAAKKEYLDIINLAKDSIIEIYAANELYRNAMECDIPYSRDDVLEFVCKRFKWFWDITLSDRSKIVTEKSGNDIIKKSYDANFTNEIMGIIKREKLLNLHELVYCFSGTLNGEMIINACNKVPQIKIYQNPRTTILQWQSNR